MISLQYVLIFMHLFCALSWQGGLPSFLYLLLSLMFNYLFVFIFFYSHKNIQSHKFLSEDLIDV